MTRFYYKTGYKDKYLKNKLIITEGLIPEKECIEFNQNEPYGRAFIRIKYFENEFIYKDIQSLVKDLRFISKWKDYIIENFEK